jgi:hypothetical protein
MTNELPKELITSALELCGKRSYDVSENITYTDDVFFSYPNFFYYLLSPEFIEKYIEN